MSKLSRRTVLAAILTLPLAAHAAKPPTLDVYKRSSCGCCKEWIKHLEAHGFKVRAHDVEDPSAMRAKAGIPDELGSCHTATVAGYAIEGHVPASDIQRLLKLRPKAIGLAVPGMPLGSPGMEGARRDPYDVLLVKDGKTSVFQHYN